MVTTTPMGKNFASVGETSPFTSEENLNETSTHSTAEGEERIEKWLDRVEALADKSDKEDEV